MEAKPDSPVPPRAPFSHMSDENLLAGYEGTSGEGPTAEMMLAEIERRKLDL